MTGLQRILDHYSRIIAGEIPEATSPRYGSYAVSALRGGIGKSTLAFNLAYELSRDSSLLVADLCAQRNLTETFFKHKAHKVDITSALMPQILGPAFGDVPDDISYRISELCESFKGGKRAYIVPGSPELFAFPSALYQQLKQASVGSPVYVRKLLQSLRAILQREAKEKGCDLILMDTSPFYSGGTHLAWCAAEALVIPVRVDEHSIESLDLTLKMLTEPGRDFLFWNEHAQVTHVPKIAAIVMTMVGAKSRLQSTPDRASQMFVERALAKAQAHPELFDFDDPADAFVLTDDFMSAGRISGAESIPISELEVGKFRTVEGKRLQVNQSAERYKKEIKYLASLLRGASWAEPTATGNAGAAA